MLRAFHNYDRDAGRYRPLTVNGYRCRHTGTRLPAVFGTCTRGGRSARWSFIAYTG